MDALQERFESGEDAVDELEDRDDDLLYAVPARQPLFGEDYIEGKRGVELSFRARLERPVDKPCQFRAVIRRYLPTVVDLNESEPVVARGGNVNPSPDDDERTMLVYVVQEMEKAEGGSLKGCGTPKIVLSVVRLHPLQDGLDRIGQELERRDLSLLAGSRRRAEIAGVLEDGKLNPLQLGLRRVSGLQEKHVGDMVQGRAHEEQEDSETHSPRCWDWLVEGGFYDGFRTLGIVLVGDSIRVGSLPPFDLLTQRFHFSVRPIAL